MIPLDTILETVLHFHGRRDGKIHESCELARIETPEALRDISARRGGCVAYLVAKLEIP